MIIFNEYPYIIIITIILVAIGSWYRYKIKQKQCNFEDFFELFWISLITGSGLVFALGGLNYMATSFFSQYNISIPTYLQVTQGDIFILLTAGAISWVAYAIRWFIKFISRGRKR